MVPFALNHMTVARASFADLLRIARELGCAGVEARNDLSGPLFDGRSPADARAMLADQGLRLLALAEVKRFNHWTDATRDAARALIETAAAAGAAGVALIPRNDNGGLGNGERQANLRLALRELAPMLRDHGLVGLVEPLGFETCALRFKAEAVQAIGDLDAGDCFGLVHDTFHHRLAGEEALFPGETGIVHISGVTDPALATSEMRDPHRGLVDARDRLDNAGQIAALTARGYAGPLSFEAFAPDVHALADPVPALRASMDFIRTAVTAHAA